jgi:small-conductance mechanosensitive channel
MTILSESLQQILNTTTVNAEILASIFTFVIIALIGWGTYLVFGRYLSRWAQKTETTLDDIILAAVRAIILIMVIILGIEYALSPLSFLQPYNDTLKGVFMVLQILLCAFAVTRVSNIVADWYAGRTALIAGKNSHHILFVLKKMVQAIIFIFAFLVILYVFNIDLTGVVVGLGVGGIAIAFALQSTLSDFFSAFSIYFDHPFEIGDFIVVGEYSGTVTNIGVKSTRLKLLQGEELIVSNKELTSTSVRNFRKMQKRRVTFTISVTYDTPLEKLKKIPQIITDIINKLDTATIERAHLTEFGDCNPKFLISYYVNSSEYVKYLDTQQQINFAIKETFEREGIEMAPRTSVVYIK